MEKWYRSLKRLMYPFFPTVLVWISLGVVVSGISYWKCLVGVCRSMDRPWELMAFFYCWLFIIVGWCTFLILFLSSKIREALPCTWKGRCKILRYFKSLQRSAHQGADMWVPLFFYFYIMGNTSEPLGPSWTRWFDSIIRPRNQWQIH
jgi:hypothetical protein